MAVWRHAKFESYDNTAPSYWDGTQRIEVLSPEDEFSGLVQLQAVSGDSIDPERRIIRITLDRETLRDFIDELERYTK